jgi:acyl-CoA thioester hydrolase
MMVKHQSFKWPVRVYYEDTDAGGVVYHSNYLNFMERARTEWLRELGFEQPILRDEMGVIIVVHSLTIAFKRPALFNDMLEINCEVVNIGRSSLEIAQTIVRESAVLIEAQVKVAFVRVADFRPVAIPQAIETALKNFKKD